MKKDFDDISAVAIKKYREDIEVQIVNSYRPKSCPYCHRQEIERFGQTSRGIQRYRCGFCNKTFIPLTGTAFESRHKSLFDWLEYAVAMENDELLNEEDRSILHGSLPDFRDLLFETLAAQRKSIIFEDYLEIWGVPCSWRIHTELQIDDFHAYITIGTGRVAGRPCTVFHYDGTEEPTPEMILNNFKDNIREKTVLRFRSKDTGIYSLLAEALNLDSRPFDENTAAHSENTVIQEIQGRLAAFLNSHLKWLHQGLQGYLDMLGFSMNTNTTKSKQIKVLRDLVLENRNA